MKKQKFTFDLNCRFAVYVPSTVNVSEKVDNTVYVNEVLRRLSELFGGATATPAFEAWVCEDGALVTENVTIVYAFCTTEQATRNIEQVVSLCEDLKKSMKQEAITLEYNGQIKFI